MKKVMTEISMPANGNENLEYPRLAQEAGFLTQPLLIYAILAKTYSKNNETK